jgi:type VI secretion system protein ImpJ
VRRVASTTGSTTGSPTGSTTGSTTGGGGGGDPRYLEVVALVRDETAGQESVEVRFAAKNLRLVLDDELASDDVALPIARIRRDGAGRFVIDQEYVPPCLHVGASERLVSMLRGVVGMLEAKGTALAASLAPAASGAGAPSAYIGNELATRWLLNAVRSAEAPLRHLLAARRVHPERLWTELARLAGALCTFSLTAQPRDLPAYDHEDLGGCFGALERHLRANLDVVVAARAIVVPLAKSSAVLHVGDVPDPRCYEPGARWFLGVRSSAGVAATIANAPRLLKVCASMYVLELVRRSWYGLTIEHVPAPPAGIAPRRDLAYFELTMDGPCADGLRKTKQVGVYVPDEIPDASFELAVLTAD